MPANRAPYKPLGDFPCRLYRAFAKPEYLDDFLRHGRFRMGGLPFYRMIEDSIRQDATEGEASYRFPGEVTKVHFVQNSDETYETHEQGLREVSAQVENPKYLFCTSLPTIDLKGMKNRFGDSIAEISAPIELAKDLCSYFEASPFKLVGGIEGCRVKYTKGDILLEPLASIEQAELSYSQKSASYMPEYEFRYVAMLFWNHEHANPPEHIAVNLNKRLSYVDIVSTGI